MQYEACLFFLSVKLDGCSFTLRILLYGFFFFLVKFSFGLPKDHDK